MPGEIKSLFGDYEEFFIRKIRQNPSHGNTVHINQVKAERSIPTGPYTGGQAIIHTTSRVPIYSVLASELD